MPDYYSALVSSFLRDDSDRIVGQLTEAAASLGLHQQLHTQTIAWQAQIPLLKKALSQVRERHAAAGKWSVLLEYPLHRLQKRIDAIILARDLVLVVEFKIGASKYDSADIGQAEDYALDLRDFHSASRHRRIIPILCATKAPSNEVPPLDKSDWVGATICANESTLHSLILQSYIAYTEEIMSAFSLSEWSSGSYSPVPTILQAAQQLYATHDVKDITRHTAEICNLERTTNRLIELVEEAHRDGKRIVAFVTGVPGSGKTLTGLNAIHHPTLREGARPAGAFLSGNTPLVAVLREALARDHHKRGEITLKTARRESRTHIQHVKDFLRQYITQEPQSAPYEHVIVFDEAQRAWNASYGLKKFKREASEPELLFRIMGRHQDWAVIVGLVGGGQEIHSGEVGLVEWGKALCKLNSGKAGKELWHAHASQEALSGGPSVAGFTLFPKGQWEFPWMHVDPALNLPVSVRPRGSQAVAQWVDLVLGGDAEGASKQIRKLQDFSIHITRNVEVMRKRLREQRRGYRRCGLVASSGAKRLRAYGLGESLGPEDPSALENWYLRPLGDVRSSNALEVVVNEFGCQGLELDLVGLCWGGDFTWDAKKRDWSYRDFRGSQWSSVKDATRRDYLKNKYRVLMTRAREEVVIWVPPGDVTDPTRNPLLMNSVSDHLLRCGAIPLERAASQHA